MKKIILIFILFSNSFIFGQKTDNIAEIEKQAWKDSVYFNRFNKGNFQIGGIPLLIFSGGDIEGFYPKAYGLHSEFGYFIRNKLMLMIENTTLHYKYVHKPKISDKAHYFFSITSTGIRYYIGPKRFTFFLQTFVNYTYSSEDTEIINNFTPVNFHRFDVMQGIGATFNTNRFDVSLELNYGYPFYYSKEIEQNRISFWGAKGFMPMTSIYLTF